MPLLPWVDCESFNPGYLMRGMHLLPKRGNKPEWLHSQDYEIEKELLPAADLEDGSLDYASEAPRLKSPLSRLRALTRSHMPVERRASSTSYGAASRINAKHFA